MTLKTQMNDDVSTVFLNTDDFAEAITYTADGESPTSINAVVERNEDTALDAFDTEHRQEQRISITVSTTDVSSFSRDDTFTIDSDLWLVDGRSQPNEFGMMTIELIRDQPFEKGNPRISR